MIEQWTEWFSWSQLHILTRLRKEAGFHVLWPTTRTGSYADGVKNKSHMESGWCLINQNSTETVSHHFWWKLWEWGLSYGFFSMDIVDDLTTNQSTHPPTSKLALPFFGGGASINLLVKFYCVVSNLKTSLPPALSGFRMYTHYKLSIMGRFWNICVWVCPGMCVFTQTLFRLVSLSNDVSLGRVTTLFKLLGYLCLIDAALFVRKCFF